MEEIEHRYKVRVSRYLTVRFRDGRYIGENSMTGTKRVLPLGLLKTLSSISEEVVVDEFLGLLRQEFPNTDLVGAATEELLATGILVRCGSELDAKERSFDSWPWGAETAEHFLATRRIRWLAGEQDAVRYSQLLLSAAPPALWDEQENPDWQPIGIDIRARQAFKIFEKRRTVRQFCDRTMPAESLGAILFAGVGIHDFLHLPYRPVHPLRFTPSPGGLNGVCAYVLSKRVDGLEPGVFQYNALNNQLRRVGDLPQLGLAHHFGNQAWMEEAAMVCVICADYKRITWKYSDQSAFNSLLIECGHIAQNMMLCAASLSIGSVPTNAIDQQQLEEVLGLPFPDRVALYAIGFGHRDVSRQADPYSNIALGKLKMLFGVTNDSDGNRGAHGGVR